MAGRKAKGGGRGVGEGFTALVDSVLKSAAWANLNPTARALFVELRGMVNRTRPEEDNGKLFMSVRDAAKRLNVSPGTANAAFHDLQRVGLIVATQVGFLGSDGHGKATTYRLADCAAQGFYPEGSKEYTRWSPGNDLPVQKGKAGPGRPAKADPEKQNPVSETETSRFNGCDVFEPPVSVSDTGRFK